MQEIAAALGLHRRTVSAIVNGKARDRAISPTTERRVLDYLAKIGYVPSRQARDLRSGHAQARHKVGILFGGQFHRHMTDAFRLLTRPLCRLPEHAEIVIAPSAQNADNIRELVARGCNDLLWMHASSDEGELREPDKILPLLQNFRRIVVYNYRFGFGAHEDELVSAGAHLIGVDRIEAVTEMARLLQRDGHQRIALFFEGNGPVIAEPLRHELGLDVFLVGHTSIPDGEMLETRRTAGQELIRLHRDEGVTAAIFNNHQSAMDAMLVLDKAGLSIPGDISFMGWSGSIFAEGLRVPLTAAEIPVETMTRKTLDLLAADAPAARHVYHARLCMRESTGACPESVMTC